MANAIHSFGAGSLRSLFLLFLIHATLIGASPTLNNVLAERAKVKVPEFENNYEGRVKKGQYLSDLFSLSDEEAAKKNDGVSLASPFQDPVAVTRNGWVKYIFWYPFDQENALDPSYDNILDKAFEDKDLPVDKTESAVYYYWHNRIFFKDGDFRLPTKAMYSNVVVPASGAFIFDQNKSPTHRKGELKKGVVPDLDTLSDIAYFQWRDGCETKKLDPKGLKVIFRSHISHRGTYDIVVQALKDAKFEHVPGWDKKAVFSMDSREGQAILGTVHGSGTAWMLIQHKEALGLKKITEVAVFGHGDGFDFNNDPEKEYANLNLRFTIKDV
ncbi:WD domain-containing protein [Colletotrichum higginsianum]|nr:WD domain-containing protein [Colletotrichum higginsianum]